MIKRIYGSLITGVLLMFVIFGVAWASEKDFIDGYYRATEKAVEDGAIEPMRDFIDFGTDFGRDTLSWIIRLHKMGAMVTFDHVSVGDKKERDGSVRLSVEDGLTITYPDERVKNFNYRRAYVIKDDRIVDGVFEYDREFPELEGVSAVDGAKDIERGEMPPVAVFDREKKPEERVSGEEKPIISFLPSPESGDVSLFLVWDTPASLIESLLGKSFSADEIRSMMEQVPPVEEGALVMTMTEDGLPEMYGAFRPMDGVDPSDAIKVVVSRISQETGDDVALKPFDGNLKDELDPLAIIQLPDGAPSLYSALWKGDGKTVLMSMSDQGLNSMLDVLSGKISAVSRGSRFNDNPNMYVRASISNEFLRSELEEDDVALYGTDDMILELGAQRKPGEVSMRWFSNAIDLFVDPSIGSALVPLGDDLPFLGGKVLGFAAAKFKRIDLDALLKVFSEDISREDFKLGVDQMTQATGLTEEDILDLMESRISFVFGGRSRSPIGDVPGVFLQIEPNNKKVLKKLAEALPRIYEMAPPVGVKELKLKGWSKAYGMNAMASAMVAVGDDRVVMGALDYEKIDEPGELPAQFKELLDGDNTAVMALSLADLRNVVQEISDMNSVFLQDEEIKAGIKEFLDRSAHLDSMFIRVDSAREGSLSVRLLE